MWHLRRGHDLWQFCGRFVLDVQPEWKGLKVVVPESSMSQTKVENTAKRTRTGGTIHGMKVTFPDGWSAEFVGRIGEKSAIRQAEELRKKEDR